MSSVIPFVYITISKNIPSEVELSVKNNFYHSSSPYSDDILLKDVSIIITPTNLLDIRGTRIFYRVINEDDKFYTEFNSRIIFQDCEEFPLAFVERKKKWYHFHPTLFLKRGIYKEKREDIFHKVFQNWGVIKDDSNLLAI